MSWETIGIVAMIAVFAAIGYVERRRFFGEARFDSKTGKRIEDKKQD
ncbi:hypothetical protein [Erythrobacter crassostreae]|uniref:Uncharacterized protein n=1 Tax=Erythrobacter crassostreae TaxID=2828328 RepID=A0A9X1JMB1_9SPHN|nr:hypothetical protein [Erythrobacter crassostrea]MBV7259224.1 hypothetical protein [Erythrobacter crassostrea]